MRLKPNVQNRETAFTYPIFTHFLTFWSLSSLTMGLAIEDRGKEAIEHFTFLHIPHHKAFSFLLERAHIFPGPPFISGTPTEFFCVPLYVPG